MLATRDNNNVNGSVVMKSSTLCSGNFTPLNDSTELKLYQFEQERTIQCTNTSTSTSTAVAIEKKKTFTWLKKKNTPPKTFTKKINWKLFRRTSRMKTTDNNYYDDDDNSSIASFSSFANDDNDDDDDDDSVCLVDCQVQQQEKTNQKKDNTKSYNDSYSTVIDDVSVPSADGTETTRSQTEEEEVVTNNAVPTIHVPMSETPDVYGQIHPIESDALINNALQVFEEQWKLLPSCKNSTALLAEQYCPNIVSIDCQQGKEFKLQFIRCEVYRIKDAIERYVNYWTKRYELFGSDRAFQPITMSSLTPNERHILSNNYTSYLSPPSAAATDTTNATITNVTVENRAIMFVDYGKFQPKTMTNNDLVRALWYLVHCIQNECIETQKRGLVIIATAKTSSNATSPSLTFYARIVQYFKKTLPIRFSGYHVLYPPLFLQILYPCTITFLNRYQIKMRLYVHTTIKNNNEIIEQFATKYGIHSNQLPTIIGGTNIVNEQQWIQQQIQNGK